MHTVSVIALTSVFTGEIIDARAEGPVLILEGQIGFLSGDEQPWAAIVPGSTQRVRPDTLFEGTIGYIAPATDLIPSASSQWDVGVFARFGVSNEETDGGLAYVFYNVIGGNYATFYTAGGVEHQEEHAIVDFEARRDVGLGSDPNVKFTGIVGARFGYLNANTDTNFVFLPAPAFSLNENRETQFIGVGPSVGFEASRILSENITFDIGVDASVLFGRRNTSAVTNGGLFFVSNSFHDSEFDFVTMLEGRLGFTFSAPNSPATLGVGIEGRAWLNAYDQSTTVSLTPPTFPGSENADRFQINPYLRLNIPLGANREPQSFAASPNSAVNPVEVESRFGPIDTVFEVELQGAYADRGGDALNQAAVNTENESFGMGSIGLLASTPVATNWILQLEADGETTFNGSGSDDNYESGYTIASHLAYTNGEFLLGVFGGAGQVEVESAATVNQDADHWFVGGEGRILGQSGAFSVQAGFLDTSADNPEVLSDSIFGRLAGQVFFNEGKTLVEADITYLSGEQDPDSGIGPDPVELISWGVELEHQVENLWPDRQTSVFVAYRNTIIQEQNTALASDDLDDNIIEAGLRIRFGPDSLAKREHDTAPGLPKFHRLIGSVPAVD
ncbi:MAG: Lpg1974 family pore-forming outer membrane protein [Pseudomonadota bacterium]